MCVHSLRTPAIRISRIESIEWNVLQCSMSPPQTISMILGLSISPILSLKMIQRFLCHFWCLASQNLAPILIATLTSLNWNEFTHGWNREQVWTGRLGDWLVPKGKHMCHNLQSNIQVTYLKHLQHVGNEIKKIFLYFIRVGPVELWRVVHWEGVCSKWANLFPFPPHGGLFLFLEGQMIGKAKFMFGRQPPDRV